MDAPVHQLDHAVAARGQARVVGHHQEGRALARVQPAHQREDLVGRGGVQVAGRLVGQHQGRLHDQRTGDRHALLHAAGQLAGLAVHRALQAHLPQHGLGLRAVRRVDPPVAHQRRQGHVLQRAERGQQVVELEHEAQRQPPLQRQAGIVQFADILAQQAVAPCAGALQQAQDVQQRALARARRADQRDELAAVDAQVQAVQHLHLVGQPGVVGLAQALQDDQRLGHGAATVSFGWPGPGPARRRGAPGRWRPAPRTAWLPPRRAAPCPGPARSRTAAGRRSP